MSPFFCLIPTLWSSRHFHFLFLRTYCKQFFLFCCMRVTFTFSFWGLFAHNCFCFSTLVLSSLSLFYGVSREIFQLFWFYFNQCSNRISQLKCFFYSPALTRSFKFPLFFEMPSLLLWNSKPPKYAPQHAFKFSSMSQSGRRWKIIDNLTRMIINIISSYKI